MAHQSDAAAQPGDKDTQPIDVSRLPIGAARNAPLSNRKPQEAGALGAEAVSRQAVRSAGVEPGDGDAMSAEDISRQKTRAERPKGDAKAPRARAEDKAKGKKAKG